MASNSLDNAAWGLRALAVRTIPLVAVTLLLGLGSSCSEGPDVSDEDDPSSGSYERAWHERSDALKMPWTHVLGFDLVEQAEFGEKTISFPKSASDELPELRPNDIIVSGSDRAPFAARILSIDRTDDRIDLRYEQPKLNEIFFKLALGTGEYGADIRPEEPNQDKGALRPDDDSRTRQRRQTPAAQHQSIGSGTEPPPPDRETQSSSSFLNRVLNADNDPDVFTGVGGQCGAGADVDFGFRGKQNLDFEPQVHLRYQTGPPDDPIHPDGGEYFHPPNDRSGRCGGDNQCARGETCAAPPSRRNDNGPTVKTCGVQVSEGSPDHFSCQELVKAAKARQQYRCGRAMKQWWSGESDDRTCAFKRPDSCGGYLGLCDTEEIRIPHKAQLAWARKHCHSGVRLLEADVRLDFLYEMRDIGFAASGGGGVFYQFWRPGEGGYEFAEFQMNFTMPTTPPIPINLTWRLSGDLMISGSAGGEFGFESDKDLVIGDEQGNPMTFTFGGVHYYATPHWREQGVRKFWHDPSDYENGKPKLKQMYQNRSSEENLTVQFPGPSNMTFFGDSNFATELRLLFNVKMFPYGKIPYTDIDFNDDFGLIFKPIEPFLKVNYGEGTDPRCDAGVRFGFEGRMGVKSNIPLCENCFDSFLNKIGGFSAPSGLCKGTEVSGLTALWTVFNTCEPATDSLLGTIFGPSWFTCENPSACADGCDTCWKGCITNCRPPANQDESVNWVKIEPVGDPDAKPQGKNDPQGIELDQVVTQYNGKVNHPEEVLGLERDWNWANPAEVLGDDDFQCSTANWRINYQCRGYGPYAHEEYMNDSTPDQYTGNCSKVRSCEDTDNSGSPDQCYHYSYASRQPVPPDQPVKPQRILTTENAVKIKFQQPIEKCSLLRVVRLIDTENNDGTTPFYNEGPDDTTNTGDTGQCGASSKIRVRLGTSRNKFGTASKAFSYNKDIRIGDNVDCKASDDALWVNHQNLDN